MLGVLCGAATSQELPSDVFNNQVQVGDVFSQGFLNVVTVEDGVDSATVATGNGVQVYADRARLSVTSNQTLSGDVIAQSRIDVSRRMGLDSSLSAIAVGNSSDVGIRQQTVTGVLTQATTSGVQVTARSQVEGDFASAGSFVADATAVGNNQSLNLTNGSAGVRMNQNNGARVLADGGAIMQTVTGQATVAGVAAGNNISAVGDSASAQRLAISQINGSSLVQASKFTAYGSVQTAQTSTTASGNALSALNQGSLLDVTNSQANSAYVRSQAEGSAYQYGAAEVSAYGAGNSAIAGYSGAELVMDNTQWTDVGGVEVIASFAGTSGYDSYVQASAVGNDVTGYACSDCNGSIDVANRQTNMGDVSARSDVSSGSGRKITGVSTATGNNASFYVTRPGS
jgi:hypothetical protein